ncbi:MAG: hypothetical protein K8T89_19715, partial [Planctomycetes bacterium]|nr:hypothetical protein [Planctomycetota bacterium]
KMADIELQLTTVQNRILAGDHDSLGQVDAGALVAVRRMVLNQSKSAGTRNRTPAMLLARSASPQALPGVRNLPVNEKSRRFAAIPLREPDAITIDGKLDDWKGVPVIELESFQKTKTKIPNHAERERAWAAYTREGLLIAVDVIDTSGKLEKNIPLGNFALNDAVEVLIDSLNTKLPKRGEPHVQHFFAFPFGHTTDEKSGGHESIIPEKGPSKTVAHPPQLFKRAAQKTERGWSMEMLIPNELLHGGGITPGRTIGFNLQLDTGTDMYWYFAAEKKLFMNQRPDTWGDLLPLGADATIELLDTDGNAINSIVAGRPFRLRIKDPDAKLGSQGPANLAVTLRTASGRRELISLEEMDVGTGIFEASIRTRLTTGDSSLGILELFEGDELAIEYVDRLRAFGERDVILSAKFHVASFGTKQRK